MQRQQELVQQHPGSSFLPQSTADSTGSTLYCCRPSARKLSRGPSLHSGPHYHRPTSQAPSALSSCEQLKELLPALALAKQYKILNEDFGLSVQDVSNIILDASCIVISLPRSATHTQKLLCKYWSALIFVPSSQPLRLSRPSPYPERQGVFALQADATLVSDLRKVFILKLLQADVMGEPGGNRNQSYNPGGLSPD